MSIPSIVKTLISLYKRDGMRFFLKCARYAFSFSAWRWLFSYVCSSLISHRLSQKIHPSVASADIKAFRDTGLFDEEWYCSTYPDVDPKRVDPLLDYLAPEHIQSRMPNADFVPDEYASLNFDVKMCGAPSVLHYLRDGIREGRPISSLDIQETTFPPNAVELRREFPMADINHRRTAIFASFSGDGRIKDTVLYYLQGLREVADNIIFISNSPIIPCEVEKLNGLVRLAVFHHHGCYDFGSYKSGWFEAKSLGLLDKAICDDLIICNDSCYGPIFPFTESFNNMRQRKLSLQSSFDFWGMTSHTLFNRPHIQSYFFVFERPVLDGMALDTFFQELGEYRDRGKVVVFCETMLTPFLVNHGHRFSSLVPENFSIEYRSPPIKFPVTLFSKYRMPLLKAKTLTGESKEPLDEAMNIVRKENPDIASLLPSPPKKTTFANSIKFKNSFLYSKHLSLLSKSIAQIREKYNNKERLKFIYFAISASNVIKYISRYTYNDIFFEVLFIPNSISNKKANIDNVMCKINSENDKLSYRIAQSDSIGEWEDVTSNADIIFYETAQDVSDFHYNPHYALCRSFLPILLFTRGKASMLSLETEFARPMYSYFWKVFFNNKEEYNNYLRYSIRKDNALLVLDGDVISTVINLINNYNTLNDLPCI